MNNPFIKIENKVKGLHNARLINPQIHWKFLVRFFLILASFLIISSLYFQYKIKNGQMFKTVISSPSQPNLVKDVLLKKVNRSFKNKEIQTIYIENKGTLFSDPSQS